jgi:2-amino-4-hydroxy-6-hydroxymethyldihydropteridine diphosphokinase
LSEVLLGLGANLGDRVEKIKSAINLLKQDGQMTVKAVSSLYESAPLGISDQPDFINCVVKIVTSLPPHELLAAVKSIEVGMGRELDSHMQPRPMDIDILLYDDQNLDSMELMIPHSRLRTRRFVLEPLLEIAPGAVDPITTKPLKEFLTDVKSQKIVKVFSADEVWNG